MTSLMVFFGCLCLYFLNNGAVYYQRIQGLEQHSLPQHCARNQLPSRSTLAQRARNVQVHLTKHRSRIAHLPADHRQDLSKKLDFVVVFQSIEIERLTH